MRTKFTAALLISVFVMPFVWTQNVSAHVLERDGNISAVLHMPPSDEPVAGQQTILNLAFASSDSRFSIFNYNVSVDVKRNGETIDTQTLQALDQSDTDGTATVELPQAGAYQLIVHGAPKVAGDTFNLEYDVRANSPAGQTDSNATDTQQASFEFWAISFGSWAVLAIIANAVIRASGRYTLRKK